MMQLAPDLHTLAQLLGPLPGGDPPVAWYISDDAEVLQGYADFKAARKAWDDRLAELLELSGLHSTRARISGLGGDYLLGVSTTEPTPKWWREHKDGYLVPRKRTTLERGSEVRKRFEALRKIPWVLNYLPGMPNTVWMPNSAYIPQVRRPGEAVLVFLGVDPDKAVEPFEPDSRWTRMKLSTYHLLRERQAAS